MRRNQMARRTYVRLAASVLVLVVCAVLGGPRQPVAEAGAGAHPTYDDGNAVRWYDTFGEARAAAARENKLVLVEVSIRDCRTCAMVVGLMRDPGLRARLSRVAVGYHVDAHRGTPLSRDFRGHLRSAEYLPWVGFFTPDRSWVTGFAPPRRVTRTEMRARFVRAIQAAETEQARCAAPQDAVALAPSGRQPVPPDDRPATPADRIPWFERIVDAQAAARAEGKLIFITSTKPHCSLCMKLKDRIVPQVWSELSKGCVLYVYDITRPESRAVDALVRANLQGAYVMPLAGFVTPDLEWRHGFFGGTHAQKLLSDYATARTTRGR